jgi:phthalate 4,5-cis-dihydrodiol dehydrogenase
MTDTGNGSKQTLRLGIIGIGVGGSEILPALGTVPEIELVACADTNRQVLERFHDRYPTTRIYETAEALCADPDVDAVWVSTPNRFHAPHSLLGLNNKKHVVVEKPMAITLAEAEEMCAAADRNGVKLLAGHTTSFSTPIRAMRKVIQSGELGPVRFINISAYSDWMLRPRTADELDPSQGGGVPYRQGPHQVDTVRVLGGGLVKSVRAMVGEWQPERPIAGFYSAFMELEGGVSATIVHNGYGYFLSHELVPWGGESHAYDPAQRVKVRKSLRDRTRDEDADKQNLRIGGAAELHGPNVPQRNVWLPVAAGMVIVSCERGDMRHSADGIWVYGDEGRREILLEDAPGVVGRRAELTELYDSVVLDKPVYHDGRWGMATLEVCLAMLESSREHREVQLTHQVPVHPDYDAGFEIAALQGTRG